MPIGTLIKVDFKTGQWETPERPVRFDHIQHRMMSIVFSNPDYLVEVQEEINDIYFCEIYDKVGIPAGDAYMTRTGRTINRLIS